MNPGGTQDASTQDGSREDGSRGDAQPGVPVPDGPELARAALSRARAQARGHPGGPRTSRGQRSRGPAVRGQDWSGPGGDRRDPQALSDVVGGLVDEHGWGEDLSVRGVLARWDQIVGVDVAAHCPIEGFVEGKLTVRTDSTAWATQVRLLTPQVLRRLAVEVGEGVVAEVVVLGPAAPTWAHGQRRVRGRGPRDTYG